MNPGLLALVAALPLISAAVLLVGFKLPAKKSMPAVYLIAAIMIGMMIQSTPVSFGAIGTPILIGVSSGLNKAEISTTLNGLGSNWDAYLKIIISEAAIVHGIIGTLIKRVGLIPRSLLRDFEKVAGC